MTSALRAAVIDIGCSFYCERTLARLLRTRPGRDVVQRGRHMMMRGPRVRAWARYRKVRAGSRWIAASLENSSRFCPQLRSQRLRAEVEDAARAQLALGGFRE